MNKINVAFRKFEDGEVIAIFPNIYPVAKVTNSFDVYKFSDRKFLQINTF